MKQSGVIWCALAIASMLALPALAAVPTGQEQPVFPASAKACAALDRADTPLHAFRDAQGKVQAIATSNMNYRYIGSDLNHLKHDCHIIFKGGQDPDPTHNNNEGWIHGTYTADGKTIYALVHNEYWGNRFLPACKNDYTGCWWNSVTWVKSTDGGKTYKLPPVDQRLVIGMAMPYKPKVGHPVGFMNPSNILPLGQYLYAYVRVMGYGNQRSGNYLIRKSLKAPWNQWQVWNGHGYADIHDLIRKGGPVGVPVNVGYPEGYANAAPMTVMSITRHQPTGLFVALMARGSRLAKNTAEQGFYIATSKNLVYWSKPQQILQANFECIPTKKGPQSFYRYYSLVDPASKDRNFSTIGNNPYVYTTKITVPSCSGDKTLELVRIPVHLQAK